MKCSPLSLASPCCWMNGCLSWRAALLPCAGDDWCQGPVLSSAVRSCPGPQYVIAVTDADGNVCVLMPSFIHFFHTHPSTCSCIVTCFLKDLFNFFCVFEICLHVCAPRMYQLPAKVRRSSWDFRLWAVLQVLGAELSEEQPVPCTPQPHLCSP